MAHQANATKNAIAPGDDPGSRAAKVTTAGVTRLSRRELGELTGLSQSVIWSCEAGTRQRIDDIRQLLHVADTVQMPREALLPVILGQPCGRGELLAEPVTAASRMAGAGSTPRDGRDQRTTIQASQRETR